MFHAYPKYDLESARENLALMFDNLVNKYGLSLDEAAHYFIVSGYDKKFEIGDVFTVSGMSGPEIARAVYEKCTSTAKVFEDNLLSQYAGRSPEYWAGYYLTVYQWESGHPFSEIFSRIPFSEIVNMYHPYHEMDISAFTEEMEKRYTSRSGETNLKKYREAAGLSQAELAKTSEVNIRSIQMFEQRVNDINKAQASTLLRLARSLFCEIEDIMEL